MPLQVQAQRLLSPLETDAIQLVFGNTVDVLDMTVIVPDQVGGGDNGSYSGHGIIKISRQKHQFAEDLDINSTVNNVDLTVPNNIKYLATLIHETGHHWQWLHQRYRNRVPEYEFDNEVLENTNFVCKEQHASVGQVYFILKWQLHHGHDPINLTNTNLSLADNVGNVDRYEPIADIPHNSGHRYIDPPEAIQLVNNFDEYLDDLL